MNLSIGIYREMTPRDVEEMIAEMKAHGIPTEQNPNLEADKEKLEAKIVAVAERADIDLPIEETLIVELYSK